MDKKNEDKQEYKIGSFYNQITEHDLLLENKELLEKLEENFSLLRILNHYKLRKYPQDFSSILKNCSTTARGIQLRRHLQLKQLVNE